MFRFNCEIDYILSKLIGVTTAQSHVLASTKSSIFVQYAYFCELCLNRILLYFLMLVS